MKKNQKWIKNNVRAINPKKSAETTLVDYTHTCFSNTKMNRDKRCCLKKIKIK